MGKKQETVVNHCLVTFLNHSFGSQDAYALQVSGLVVYDGGGAGGVCQLILSWRNNHSLYVNDVIDNSNCSHLILVG